MNLAGYAFSFGWEVSLIEWLQNVITGAAAAFVSAMSAFGEELMLILILCFIYFGYDKKMGRYIGLNLLMVNVFCPMIKNIVLRRRPYFDHSGVQILRAVDSSADIYDISSQGYSFPSGHSASAAAVYGSLGRYTKKKPFMILAFLLPLLVGFSRVFVGAHYPTDVFAGYLIGTIVIFLIPLLDRAIRSRTVFYGILLLLTLPGFFYCRSNDYFTSMGMLIGFIAGCTFEEKTVRFENTRSPLRIILRVLGGGGLFFALNTLLKIPFSQAFLSCGTFPSLLVRTMRYAIVIFLLIGVYPMVFRYADRFFKDGRKEENASDPEPNE